MIASYQDLLNFANRVNNGDTFLNAEIVAEKIDASASASGNAWTPIGTPNNPYKGTFDGKGKKINGLTFDNSSQDFAGLFGYVGIGGNVNNVVLEDGSISGKGSVGGVVGYIDLGEVKNCYNTGAVSGDINVGGVVGYNKFGTVENCYNTGAVSGTGEDVGGVVGYSEYGTVKNCYNTGAVSGDINVGGVVGYNKFGTVENCYNTGAVTGTGKFVGGVVGYIEFGEVENCYSTGAVSGNINVGGVVGYIEFGTVENCYYDRNVCAIKDATETNNWKAFGEGSGTNVTGLTTAEMTGDNAGTYLKPLTDAEDDNGEKIWIIQDNTFDTYYYPHLAGFEYSKTKDFKDWPAKTTYTFELSSTSLTYNGEDQAPTVTVKKDGVAVDSHPYSFMYGESINAGRHSITVANKDSGKPAGLAYEIKKRQIEITVPNQTFLYNGLNHGTDDVQYMDDEIEGVVSISGTDGLALTDSLSLITIAGQLKTDAGTYEGVLVPKNAKIVNTTGQNMTENYDIKYVSGDLIITPMTVKLTANSGETTTYDGTEKTVSGYKCSVEGLTFDGISAEISATKPGTYEVTFSNVTLNQTTDSTGNYVVSETTNGTLTISKRPLTITADSDTKVYDGTALTKDSVSAEGLADGDKIESVTVTGSQTMAGQSNNVPSEAKIVNAAGEDVTKCYEITYAKGTLEVTKKALTITAESASKEYDKTALTKDSYTFSGLADGDSIKSIAITGSQTMKGSSDNVPSAAKIVNVKGEDVTSSYDITYKNGTLTVTASDAPSLDDDQKPAPKKDLKEDGKEQILVLDPANLPEGYTIEYSTDGGKTWNPVPTGSQSGEYTIEVFYKADENHTDFFGDPLNVIIQGVYNQTESDGDWTKGSGKTYTFRIKKAFNDEVTYDNLTGVFVDGKQVEAGKDYTPAKGSAIITFAADYLETLSVGEHKIRVTFKDGEATVPLKVLAAIATPAPAVDATPTTGDTSMPILWTTLILLSMAGASVVMMRRRKRA